jgi:hypothetical protein
MTGGTQVVQVADQQGNPPFAAAPEKPSNWTRFWGVFDVIGGLGEAAVGGTGVVASGVGTVFSGGSAAPVSIPLLFGSSVVTLHGLDQAWAGVTTVYWGTRQRPIAAQGLDTVTGNEMASDLLNGGAGIAMTGGVGLAVKGAGLGTRALSSGDDVGRAVGTTLDDGAKAAGAAARGAGDEAVGALGDSGLGKMAPNSVNVSDRNLQKIFGKHGGDFGLSGNWNPSRAAELRQAITSHLDSQSVQWIAGTYRGQNVIHVVDPSTGLNVILDEAGNVIGGWKLGADQLQSVMNGGRLF